MVVTKEARSVLSALCEIGFGICGQKSIGVDSHFLLKGIFPTQGLNLGLLHRRQILYHGDSRKVEISLVLS